MEPSVEAAKTARWATTLTKWLISRTKSRTDWHLVEFTGNAGKESKGIVDVLAIHKDHSDRETGSGGDH
jgi:hypothetical protein